MRCCMLVLLARSCRSRSSSCSRAVNSLALARTKLIRHTPVQDPRGGRTICPLINPLIIDMLKLPERLDDIEIIFPPSNDILRPSVNTIIEYLQGLSSLIQSLTKLESGGE